MDLSFLPALITAITGTLIAFGGGVRWILVRMDSHTEKEREWQNAEREKLETEFKARIEALEQRITQQDHEIESTRSELRAYIRHVGVLEGLLKANSVDVPPLELPHDR